MPDTPLLALPLLEAGQSQKHVTHNEALMLLDAAIHLSVISRSLGTPPATPAAGDRYLVNATPSGAWAGNAGALAVSDPPAWRLSAPRSGWRLWVEDEAKFLVYDGTAWIDLQAISSLANMALLGVNATADVNNRLTVSSPGVLFNHAGTDHRLKLNKQAAANTASLLFQTGFSGRAEMGLAGDDNFHFKVSPNGTTWNAAIDIDRSTGAVSFPNTASTGVSDGNKGDVTVGGGAWSVERSGGAVGDGSADDTAALQSVLTAGKTVILNGSKSYRIRSRLTITAAGTGIIGNGARLIMDLAAGGFDNTSSVATSRYNANAIGILATSVARPVLRDLRIEPAAFVEGRFVRPMAFRDCDDVEITGCNISGFSCCFNLIHLDDCAGGLIGSNYLHDCTTNHTVSAQITGIGTDLDSGSSGSSGRGSSNLVIAENRIEDLTVGAAFLASFGYQTDGINAGFQSTGLVIAGNRIVNCAEGLDIYATDCTVSGNAIRGSYNYGIKLVHGASRIAVTGNQIRESGFGAILLAGTTTRNRDTADNLISGNIISGVNPLHDHDANSTFGISIRANGGTTYLPRRNRIWDNTVDLGGTAKSGITAETAGGTLNDIRRNAVSNVTLEDYNVDATTAPVLERDTMAANSLRGNNTATAAVAVDLTAAQATAMLNAFTPALKGLAPASGGGTANFLRADGTWAAPSGGGGVSDGDKGDIVVSGGGTVWSIDTAALAPYAAGPASAADNAVARFDGTTGKLIQNSGVLLNDDGSLSLPLVAAPAAAGADKVVLYAEKKAGRMMPGFRGIDGIESALQASLARNRIFAWNPAGNSTTVGALGSIAPSAIGTATAANVATTNLYSMMRCIEYLVTTAAATAIAGFRSSTGQFFRGAAAGQGGFHMVCRWGAATGVATATNRCFIGLRQVGTPTDVEPSSLANILGVGWDAADANIQFMCNDAAGVATKIDLGAGLPVPTVDRTSVFEVEIFCAPNGTAVFYEVTNLTTGATASGSAAADLPAATILLAPHGWMSVGGTSSVIGLALMNLYIETDY